MKSAARVAMAAAAVVLALLVLGSRRQLDAAEAPAAGVAKGPATLWNFLGIPQGIDKVRDALTNPRGRHPKWERKPPLKRLADAANLQSDNPAIKVAAKVKADADLAPQKIKAIKYLATLCCGCGKNKDEVQEALLAALDDCTEAVRYEAAVALCQCAGDPRTVCNQGSCCDAKVMNKLLKVSEGKDDQGCWLEPSARVRAAAANALNACQMVRGPTAAKEAPPKKGEAPAPELPTPSAEKQELPAPPQPPESLPPDSRTSLEDSVTPAGFVEIQDAQNPIPLRLRWPASRSSVDVRFQGRIVSGQSRPGASR